MSESIDPRRLDELLDGAPPRDSEERELVALVTALRAVEPPAPPSLHERVAALAGAGTGAGAEGTGARAPVREGAGSASGGRRLLPRLRWDRRRALAVGLPVAAGLAALAIAVPTLVDEGGGPAPSARLGDDQATPAQAGPESYQQAPASPAPAPAPPQPGQGDLQAPKAARERAAAADVRLSVSVPDAEALARARAQAIALVRGLDGTASAVAGAGPGRLLMRVPAARADKAVAGLAALGEVTGRQGSVEAPVEPTQRDDRASEAQAPAATIDLTLAVE